MTAPAATPDSTHASGISVFICTYNRCENLAEVLQRLVRQQDVEALDWEVVIVDNNSSDGTAQEVARLAAELPIRIRYAFEPQQGLNYARNRAIDESSGSYFVYIDDDILVTERWLASVWQALVDNDADAVGGRIHLPDDVSLPNWIKPEMYGFLGYQDFGDEPFQMDGVKQSPFGGNMAFNRRVVDRVGKFNPAYGRKGEGLKRKELYKGAETEFLHRLAADGGVRVFYAPGAIVFHMIKSHQLQKRYFRILHFNHGLQEAMHNGDDYPRRLFGVPLFLFEQVRRALFKYLGELFSRGTDAAFRQQMNLAYFVGRAIGFSRANRSTGG